MTITQVLRGEHGAIKPLLDFIEGRLEGATAAELAIQAEMLSATLLTHASIEDQLLRPEIVDNLPAPDPGGDTRTDHEVIADLLVEVSETPERMARRRLLRDAVAATRKHLRKEEAQIFPLSERVLSLDKQQALGSAWACRRNVR